MTITQVAERGALPNLIVIGTAQCGTSALHYYLDLHPEIQMSSPKELNFFISAEDLEGAGFARGRDGGPRPKPVANWERGVAWYASRFQEPTAIRGESSVAYTLPWCPDVAGRMASVLPETKLILMARDPVERVVSQYVNYRAMGWERRSLAESLSSPDSVYLARSRYMATLRPFLERFPRSSIHLERQEDLLARRRETLTRVFAFLGIDETFWSPDMERLRNRSGAKGRVFRFAERFRRRPIVAPLYRLPPELKWRVERLLSRKGADASRPVVSQDVRRSVLNELAEDISELERLTGWDLSAWRSV